MISFLAHNALDIAQALLALLGALKVLARYTKTEADDKALAMLEAPITAVLGFFKKDKE